MIDNEITLRKTDQPSTVDDLLDRFAHFGVELGLERIQALLAALGNPHQSLPILHVAGSNGKGSVCAFLSSVLTQAGYRVGRYTSPHLVDWCERICISEIPIDPSHLYSLLQQVIAAIQPACPSPTQFEVITAAAWLHFAQQQVDIAVIEVGLGGRLDATNVCDRPLVSIITSLSREHWQRLGSTLAEIAGEKAGILKPNCPAVLAPLPPETIDVINRKLAELNCPAIFPSAAIDLGNGWAEYLGTKYPLPLLGEHQLMNSALAIAALQLLQQQGWQISDQAIVEGMAKTQWRGRLQWMTWEGQPLLIDGAHNPAGAAALRRYLDGRSPVRDHRSDRGMLPIAWVIGMIGGKDHKEVLQALLRSGDRLYLVPVPDHSPVDLVALAQIAQNICPGLSDCQICSDEIAGLQAAQWSKTGLYPTPTACGIPEMAELCSTAPTIVLCGSLYLIGRFFRSQSELKLLGNKTE